MIYTTNALESVHARLRNITAAWWKAANYWHHAMNQFAILNEDRFTAPRA